ncbi:MAG: MFS transporter [Pseudomonadota bacterium]
MSEIPAPLRRLANRPAWIVVGVMLVLLLLAQLGISLYAWSLADQHFTPELERKAQNVGTSVARKLARAISYGIAPDQTEGVQEFLDDVLAHNPDLAYITMTDSDGMLRYRSGAGGEVLAPEQYKETTRDIVYRYSIYGTVHVGVDRRHITARSRELTTQLCLVALVSAVAAFEAMRFAVALNYSAPLRQMLDLMTRIGGGDFRYRASGSAARSLAHALNGMAERINHTFQLVNALALHRGQRAFSEPILLRLRRRYSFAEGSAGRELAQDRSAVIRILIFLMLFADMLTRATLPLYGLALAPAAFLPPLRAALPVATFLLACAVMIPLAARWSGQFGRRHTFVGGALLLVLGLASAALPHGYWSLILARVYSGGGYALALASCQALVFDQPNRRGHEAGVAAMIGALAAAELCAPAIGAMLADVIGVRQLFLIGAAVATLSALAGLCLLAGPVKPMPLNRPMPRLRMSNASRSERIFTLSLLAGAPAAFVQAGFLLLLAPLLLADSGNAPGQIGYYLLAGGVAGVLAAPLGLYVARRYTLHVFFVLLGQLAVAAGLLWSLNGPGNTAVLVGIVATGIGQGIGMPSQFLLVARVARSQRIDVRSSPVLAIFRCSELLGAGTGVLAAAALASAYSARVAVPALGVIGILAASTLAFAFFISDNEGPA